MNQEVEVLKAYENSNLYHRLLQDYLSDTWKKDILKQSTDNQLPPLPKYLTDISYAKTFVAKVFYHATRVEYFQYRKMIDEQLEESLAIVKLFEAQPQFIIKNSDIYILTIGIISILYLNKKEFKQLVIWRERLEAIKESNEDSDSVKNIFILLNELRVEIFIPSGVLSDVVKRTDKFLSKRIWLPGIKDIYLIFNVIILLIKQGEFNEALNWQRKYERKIKKPQMKFYALRIQILELIIHYEIGSTRLLESLVNNTYNYMHRNNALTDENNLLISFFKKIVKNQDTQTHKKLFAQLVNDIELIQKRIQLYFIIQFLDFDFLEWARERS